MWAIVVFHFAIPFFLLLMRPIKRNSTAVAWIAGLILFMQLVFMYYQIMPGLSADGLAEHWMDLLMPLGIGGIWLAYFLWQLQRQPLVAAARLQSGSRPAPAPSRRRRGRPRGGARLWIRKRPTPTCATSGRTSGCAGCWRCWWSPCCCRGDLGLSRSGGSSGGRRASQEAAKRSPYPLAPTLSAQLPPEPRLEQLDRLAGVESSDVDKRLAAQRRRAQQLRANRRKGIRPHSHPAGHRGGRRQVAGAQAARRPTTNDNGLIDAGESNSGRMFRGEPR